MMLLNPRTTELLHELADEGVVPGVSYAMIHQGEMQSEVFGKKKFFQAMRS